MSGKGGVSPAQTARQIETAVWELRRCQRLRVTLSSENDGVSRKLPLRGLLVLPPPVDMLQIFGIRKGIRNPLPCLSVCIEADPFTLRCSCQLRRDSSKRLETQVSSERLEFLLTELVEGTTLVQSEEALQKS